MHKFNVNIFLYVKIFLLRTKMYHEKGFTRPSAHETDIGFGYYRQIYLYL